MKIFNTSRIKTANHNDDGRVYSIEPGQLMEIPDHIAKPMLAAWPELREENATGVRPAKAEPWETRCGPAWEAAKLEHRINLDKKQETVGPDRPPVVEPPIPADAKDPETGHISEEKLNKHLCTYCQEEFAKLGNCRNHMKKVHGV